MNVKHIVPSTSESHNRLVHSVTRSYDGACGLGKLVLFSALCQGNYLFDFSLGAKGWVLRVQFSLWLFSFFVVFLNHF